MVMYRDKLGGLYYVKEYKTGKETLYGTFVFASGKQKQVKDLDMQPTPKKLKAQANLNRYAEMMKLTPIIDTSKAWAQ